MKNWRIEESKIGIDNLTQLEIDKRKLKKFTGVKRNWIGEIIKKQKHW
jgi:hypothetical protein